MYKDIKQSYFAFRKTPYEINTLCSASLNVEDSQVFFQLKSPISRINAWQ